MFRSFASSLITFVAVLLFAVMILFLWQGSKGVQFTRVAFEGDRTTEDVLEEYRRANMAAAESAMDREEEKAPPPPAENSGDGPAVVVWINISGFRGDYIEKSEAPFFKKLAEDGSATNKMRPNFPCLTFPAHATMATGVTPDKHGIVADRIRTGPGEIVDHPTDGALLLAEPIWTTATRQGIPTLVHDWPLSQNQTGEHAAAYFLDSYDPESSDEVRLNKALEQWRVSAGGAAPATNAETPAPAAAEGGAAPASAAPAGGNKLRLLMLRLEDIARAGLVHGPRADETYAAVAKTDQALQTFFDTVRAEWATLAPPNANLVIFITTDHGLAELDKNVNIAHLLGDEMMKNADIIAHDAVANLFFKDLTGSEGEQKIFMDKFDNELSKRIYFRTLKREELPADWAYLHPDRTGDRILVLKTGYAFADHKADEPIFDPADGPGFFGGFGYPVGESIRMSGQIFLAGYPQSPLSGALDEIGQLAFHATVCKLLGIEPAAGAATETLPVK
ncbi:MAG: alkaline phosphatase family protein [Verrucomicrobiaceae bacterium]|nr:alkaline phosphatase family protein [Verrucomicrobiaceae bacterium]